MTPQIGEIWQVAYNEGVPVHIVGTSYREDDPVLETGTKFIIKETGIDTGFANLIECLILLPDGREATMMEWFFLPTVDGPMLIQVER